MEAAVGVSVGEVDVAIVGGGLSGLVVARGLEQAGVGWILLEAHSSRLGGRIKNTASAIDLGAAWLWPHQQQLADLLQVLEIETYPQPDDQHSIRVAGGTYAMIEALAAKLPAAKVRMGCAVARCCLEDGMCWLSTAEEDAIRARKVVFACPPRMLALNVEFEPSLAPEKAAAMERSRTWMAGVTKCVIEYPKRSWSLRASNCGLQSQGPAFQVYDGSTFQDKNVALTFFTLADADLSNEELARQCIQQLREVWRSMGVKDGGGLDGFSEVHVQRWPQEPFIGDDRSPTTIHPHPEPVTALASPDWDGRLQFAGTECDLEVAGVMEGAVGSANRVLSSLLAE